MGNNMLSNLVSYKHTQTVPASTWIIEHGLSTDVPVIDCWVTINDEVVRVAPRSIERIDGSAVKAIFSSDRVGFAVVA